MKFYFVPILLLSFFPIAFAATQPPPTVITEIAKSQPIFNILTYPARVESRVRAMVRVESDGAVTKILKPLGSRVRRGEVVAIVRHTDPVYQYAPLNVIASVSGVVNEVQVTVGSLVNKGDPIVTITDPDQLRISLDVAAVDLKQFRTGLEGELSIPSFPSLKATVQGVSPSVDPMLGTATCELKLSAEDQKKVVPGMVGSVRFEVNQRKGYLIPDYAVVYRGDKSFLRVVEKGVAKRIQVNLGEKRQGQVEIISGIKDGDQVIDRASRFVAEGEAVQVETAHE